jgi:enoyl-CoA hydratase
MSELVLREDRDGRAVLTLNRPEALNALSPELFVELRAHVDAIAGQTDTVGVVILKGAGRGFSAGNDLKAIAEGRTAPSRHFQAETIDALEALPQPVLGAIHGPCFTGALELALGCDLLVAAESARFCDTHGRFSLSPTWGMSQRLPRRVGHQRARELMFTARELSGRQAAELGLALECVPDEQLEARVDELADAMLANAWFTLRADKFLLNGGLDRAGAEGLRWEREHSPGRGPDMEERIAAFTKRR